MVPSIEQRAAAIDALMNLIPAKFLIENEEELWEDTSGIGGSWSRGRKKEPSRKEKALKYDPMAMKPTVAMIVEECMKGGPRKAPPTFHKAMPGRPNARSTAMESSDRHQALREKLQAKIKEIRQQKRKAQSEKDKAFSHQKRQERMAQDPNFVPKDRKRKEWESKKPDAEEIPDAVEFSSMDFKQTQANTSYETWVNKPGSKAKRLKQQIAAAEKAQKAMDKAGGEELKDMAMERSMQKAQGVKVKDDLSKLKKTQRTVEEMKSQHSAKWNERRDNIKQSQADRQTKRKENLQKKVMKKKGLRPGFEGKKDGFLNEKGGGEEKQTRKQRKAEQKTREYNEKKFNKK